MEGKGGKEMIPIIQEIAADGQVKTNPWKTTVILLAIAVSVFAWLYFVQRGESTSATTSGTTSGAVSGAIGTIKLPNGQTVNVKYDGPPELKATLEQGTARETVAGIKDSYQVGTTTSLTNVSSGNVKYSEIAYMLGGTQSGFEMGRTLAPGEKITLIKGFSLSGATTITVKVVGFQKTPGSSIQPVPTPPVVKSGSWSQVFQTKDGPVKVNYTETNSAKGKVKVWAEIASPDSTADRLKDYIQNTSSNQLTVVYRYKSLDAKGSVMFEDENELNLAPGKTWDSNPARAGAATIQIEVEVK